MMETYKDACAYYFYLKMYLSYPVNKARVKA